MNRWIGLVTFCAMVAANAALWLRDVAPQVLAGEPPPSGLSQLVPGQEVGSQTGIYDAAGRRLGYSWTVRARSPDVMHVRTTTVVLLDALSSRLGVGRIRIDTELSYVNSQQLDTLTVRVRGLGVPLKLSGEFVPPNDFPCQWQVADRRGSFVLPAQATRSIGDALHPFQSMTDLRPGQSWTLEVINPLAAVLPEMGLASLTSTMVAKVSGVEWIQHGELGVRATVVEADRVRAWVSPTGRVLRQEVDLPLIGKLVLRDEAYDDDARRRFVQATSAEL